MLFLFCMTLNYECHLKNMAALYTLRLTAVEINNIVLKSDRLTNKFRKRVLIDWLGSAKRHIVSISAILRHVRSIKHCKFYTNKALYLPTAQHALTFCT